MNSRFLLAAVAALMLVAAVAIVWRTGPEAPPPSEFTPVVRQEAAPIAAPPAAGMSASSAGAAEPVPAEPVQQHSAKVVVRGRVVDALTGAALANARIAVGSHKDGKIADAIGQHDTDEEGRFELALPIGNSSLGLLAHAPGYSSVIEHVSPRALGEAHELEFALSPVRDLVGRVLDGDGGAPIAGAVVTVNLMTPRPVVPNSTYPILSHIAEPLGSVTTDESGSFRFERLPVAGTAEIAVSHDRYALGGTRLALENVGPLDILLRRGSGEIHGVVRYDNDEPTPDAILTAFWPNGNGTVGQKLEARTNAAGEFRFSHLPAGKISMTIDREEMLYQEPRAIELGEGASEFLEIVVPMPKLVHGRTLVLETDEPIAGVQFAGGFQGAATVSDSEGKWSLLVSAHKERVLPISSPPQYLPAVVETKGGRISRGTLRIEDFDSEILVYFRKTEVLILDILQPDGVTPAADAAVLPMNEGTAYDRNLRTDSSGRIMLPLHLHGILLLDIRHESGGLYASLPRATVDASKPMVLTLGAHAMVSGFVRNSDETPRAGEMVSLWPTISDRGENVRSGGGQTKTDANGFYELSGITPGADSYTVSVADAHSGLAPAVRSQVVTVPPPVAIQLQPGQHRSGVDFTFGDAYFIEGVVLDEDGTPVVERIVSAMVRTDHGGFSRPVEYNGKGGFLLHGLTADTKVNFGAYHKDLGSAVKNGVGVLDSPIELRLVKPDLHEIELRVTDRESGAPVPLYAWRIFSGHGEQTHNAPIQSGIADSPDGVVVLTRMRRWAFTVDARRMESADGVGNRGEFARKEITIDADAPQRVVVDLEVDTARVLHGRVQMLGTGKPVVGTSVRMTPWNRTSGGNESERVAREAFTPVAITDADGGFSLSGIRPGQFYVGVEETMWGVPHQVRLSIPEHGDPDFLLIELPGEARIYGVLRDAHGKPIPTHSVECSFQMDPYGRGPFSRKFPTGADGSFSFAAPQATDILITVAYPDHLPHVATVKASAEGEDLEHNITLQTGIELVGNITINGKPWHGIPTLRFLGAGNQIPSIRVVGDGQYRVALAPGDYRLMADFGTFAQVAFPSVVVATDPQAQRRDFAIQTADLTVAVVFPSAEDFSPGMLRLYAEDTQGEHRIYAQGDLVKVPAILVGRYRARFEVFAGGWHGTSDEFTVTAGEENLIMIDMKRMQRP